MSATGLPSKNGSVNDPVGPILRKVFKENRFRKIKINTFGFSHIAYPSGKTNGPLQQANKFLKELAEATGGKFTQMKVNIKYTPDKPYGK